MQHSAIENTVYQAIFVMVIFFLSEFLAYYTLENKSVKIFKHYPDKLDDNFIESSNEECLNFKIN